MPYLSRTTIIGHLGRDPEAKFTPNGVAKTSFSVAVADKWKDKQGEPHEETEWFNVVAWRMDWLANQLHKGALVYVEGKIKTREYETQSGEKRKITELVADRVLPLNKQERSDVPASAPRRAPAAPVDDGFSGMGITDEDVPF